MSVTVRGLEYRDLSFDLSIFVCQWSQQALGLSEVLWYVCMLQGETEGHRERGQRSNHCISGVMKGPSVMEGQGRLTLRRKDRLLSLIVSHISSQRRRHGRTDVTGMHTPHHGGSGSKNVSVCMSESVCLCVCVYRPALDLQISPARKTSE